MELFNGAEMGRSSAATLPSDSLGVAGADWLAGGDHKIVQAELECVVNEFVEADAVEDLL
jgi:hypothetical protein